MRGEGRRGEEMKSSMDAGVTHHILIEYLRTFEAVHVRFSSARRGDERRGEHAGSYEHFKHVLSSSIRAAQNIATIS